MTLCADSSSSFVVTLVQDIFLANVNLLCTLHSLLGEDCRQMLLLLFAISDDTKSTVSAPQRWHTSFAVSRGCIKLVTVFAKL